VQMPLEILFEDLVELMTYLGEGTVETHKLSMAELFKQHLQVDLTPETSTQTLRQWCDDRSISHSPDDTYSDLFHRLFLQFVEPYLMKGGLMLVYDYPPQLAAYARISAEGWAQRQEVYWRGMELANGFFEVCSPQEQLTRMAADNEAKKNRGAATVGMDPDFYLHLRQGFPASSGMALGLDRLFMALKNVKDIGELRSF
jgi:lysyl-tRNA synthetase class 2